MKLFILAVVAACCAARAAPSNAGIAGPQAIGPTLPGAGNASLGDVQTRVVFRQSTDQLGLTGRALQMNDRLVEVLPRLTRGRAVWCVAGRWAVVQHVIGAHEITICDTDQAMVA